MPLLWCQWPKLNPATSIHQQHLHFAVVADPQLTDYFSYDTLPSTILPLVEYFNDLYLRRVFASIEFIHQPEHIWFVGDLHDGGRTYQSQEVFDRHVKRFNSVFGNVNSDRTAHHHYMPGNHDVGILGYYNPVQAKRYTKVFGPLSQRLTICDTEFVTIDSVGLTLDGVERKAARSADDQVRTVSQGDLPLPASKGNKVVMFSHIPLFRSDTETCGSLRQNSRPIYNAAGTSYQNMLPKGITKKVLSDLMPLVVFSGDDHDNCLFHHKLTSQQDGKHKSGSLESLIVDDEPIAETVPEYTVGTLSWLQGVWQPSYALVTIPVTCNSNTQLGNSMSSKAAVNICFPVNQYHTYILYGIYGILSLLSLMMVSIARCCAHKSKVKVDQASSGADCINQHATRISSHSLSQRTGDLVIAMDTKKFDEEFNPNSLNTTIIGQQDTFTIFRQCIMFCTDVISILCVVVATYFGLHLLDGLHSLCNLML